MPANFGYLCSRWITKLRAIMAGEIIGCHTFGQPSRIAVCRRSRVSALALRIRDPKKEVKMTAMNAALAQCSKAHPVFYDDEVYIQLNSKPVPTGRCVVSTNALPHQARRKSIIRRKHCTVAQDSSVTRWQLLKKISHFLKTISYFPPGYTCWQKCNAIRCTYLTHSYMKIRALLSGSQ